MTGGDGEVRFESGGLGLMAHLAVPERGLDHRVAVVICHGFPSDPGGGANSTRTYPGLADLISEHHGCAVMTFSFRGCGASPGDFSLLAWRDDVRAAVAFVRDELSVDMVLLIGFGTGGALAICAAGDDEAISGVAAMAAPADFDDWARAPLELIDHARFCEVISTPGFPEDLDAWSRELREIRPVDLVASLADRPLLLVHGSQDDLVPVFDARILADSYDAAATEKGSVELRIITGAGHHLRHDPRAIALLLGWIGVQLDARHRSSAPSRR